MTTYTIFTDPHIGTKRAAHTTRESAARLEAALYDSAMHIVAHDERPICAGDLFDKAFNNEATLVQGFNVARLCHAVLAGNHDLVNRADVKTSLQALREVGCPVIAASDLTEPTFSVGFNGLYFVPHHASQDLFEKALLQAKEDATESRSGRPAVLFLHCNYGLHEVMLTNDATLNLPEPMAKDLLEAFDLILIGHDHNPRRYLDGRVVILGNTHPTSFSDISDKFKYTLNITDEEVKLDKELIWSMGEGFAEIRLGDDVETLPAGVQFVNVFGMADASQAAEVSDFIRSVWEARPGAFAVRNNVQIGELQVDDDVEPPKLVNLRERIEGDLAGSDLLELFSELAKECGV